MRRYESKKTARQHCADAWLSEIFGAFTHTKMLNIEFQVITTQFIMKNGFYSQHSLR